MYTEGKTFCLCCFAKQPPSFHSVGNFLFVMHTSTGVSFQMVRCNCKCSYCMPHLLSDLKIFNLSLHWLLVVRISTLLPAGDGKISWLNEHSIISSFTF